MRRALRHKLGSTESLNIPVWNARCAAAPGWNSATLNCNDSLEKLRPRPGDLVRRRNSSMGAWGRHAHGSTTGTRHQHAGPALTASQSPPATPHRCRRGRPDAEECCAWSSASASRSKAIVQALHNYARGDDSVQRELNWPQRDDTVDLLRHAEGHPRRKEIQAPARVGYPGQIDQVLMNL